MSNTNFQNHMEDYLQFCANRKNLNGKTIKSYSIDLKQFDRFMCTHRLEWQEKSP